MAIQYSGAAYSSTFTTTTGTRREIVDNAAAKLVSAGWSYQSGSGTGDVKMLSATTAQGMKTVVRIYDPGSGNCARFKLYNSGNTLNQTGDCFLLPAAAKTFQFVANPYQFFIFVTGSTTTRDFVAGGTPWIPSWNSGISETGWLMGNAQSDTDTTARPSLRTVPGGWASGSNYPNYAAYTNTSLWENNASNFGVNNAPGPFQLMAFGSYQYVNNLGNVNHMTTWYDGSGMIYEPICGWTSTSTAGTQNAVAIGQLWDCAMMTVPFAIDTTTTFDGHNWINLHNNTGSNAVYARSSMWLATT